MIPHHHPGGRGFHLHFTEEQTKSRGDEGDFRASALISEKPNEQHVGEILGWKPADVDLVPALPNVWDDLGVAS